MNKVTLTEHNLVLININDILAIAEHNCLNEIYDYNLIDFENDPKINLKSINVRRLIYHNVIYTLCEEVLKINNKSKTILFVPPNFNCSSQFKNFCDIENLNGIIHKILNQIKNKLPIPIFFSKEALDFGNLKDKCFRAGEKQEVLFLLLHELQLFQNKSYSFEAIKKFTTKYKLTFLSTNYFDKLKTKQLLY